MFQICDADLRILSVNARYGGSAHDAFVWNNSAVNQRLRQEFQAGNNNESWLLGDSGYGVQPWLMTPILNPTTDAEEIYNIRHRKARHLVERCIGILKNRFRCISRQRILMYDPSTAGLIINSCVVLHNIMIAYQYDVPGVNDDEHGSNENDVDRVNSPQSPTSLTNQGVNIRNTLIANYFTIV